ncbi:MAG: hypothetical protein GXP24_02235 [Planctomycetes bacterium]|nr:hypothetical protein [Planctomycetota bacterium]
MRISLKWLLIGFTFFGAALGLLARSLFHSPDVFRLVVGLLATAVPFLLAVGTIIRLGYRSHQKRLLAWGWLLALAPVCGFLVLFIANKYIGTAPGGIGILSNAILINQRLPQQIDGPWVWRELSRRGKNNSLSQSEVDSAIRKLIAHMKKTKPQGWNSPLPWSDNFLKDANAGKLISDPVVIDLCDAFYGNQLQIERITRLREGESTLQLSVSFGNPWSDNSGLPAHLLWTVSQVLIDGKSVQIEQPRHFGQQWNGNYRGLFDAGDHELTVELDCAYVDTDKLLGIRSGANESFRWPKQTRKKWKQTVKTTFKVFAAADTLVALSTDPKEDPTASRAIQIERFVILPGRNENKKALLIVRCSENIATPLSFDISATLGNQKLELGSFFKAHLENRSISSGNELTSRVENLNNTVTTADVLLTPNPKHVEDIDGVEKIWGKPILFRNVAVERLDLETVDDDRSDDNTHAK